MDVEKTVNSIPWFLTFISILLMILVISSMDRGCNEKEDSKRLRQEISWFHRTVQNKTCTCPNP